MSSELGETMMSEGGDGTGMTAKLARATEAYLIWVRRRYVYFFVVVVEEEVAIGCHATEGSLSYYFAELHQI